MTLSEQSYHRQLDILPPDKTAKPIKVIGCGGIGSATVFTLAKMGFKNITAYDDDRVEIENVPSQLFKVRQVGESKAVAIRQTCKEYADINVRAKPERYDGTIAPIVISAVDSMRTRQEIYNTLKTKFSVELYIEARMSAEKLRIYALTPSDTRQQADYESTLYDDDQASQELCTAKAISYNTFLIGSLVASIVKKQVMRQEYPKELIFDLTNYGFIKT